MSPAGRLVVIVALLASGCTAPDTPSPATGCGSAVLTDPLPTWARAGFSTDGSGAPHVLGRRGDILGVLFGNPLTAPPAADRSNKILWVSRAPVTRGDPLEITAQLDGTSETVNREVAGGPGPSGIDLPSPGCWHLTLSWSGNTDTMDLIYQPGDRVSSATTR
jgi:hypothetical protein